MIIGQVGRRSTKVRILNVMIHLVLCLGAISMVYPMLLMLSGSVKSNLDRNEMDPIPNYFTDEVQLFRKYVETKYNEKVDQARACHRRNYFSFEDVEAPGQMSEQAVEDWREYLRITPPKSTQYELAFTTGLGIIPKNWRLFKAELRKRYDGDIEKLNADLGTYYNTWWQIVGTAELLQLRTSTLVFPGIRGFFQEFKSEQPLSERCIYSLSGQFTEDILKVRYSPKIQQLNEKLGTTYPSYEQINLTRECPEGPLQEHWLHYVRSGVNLQFVRVKEAEAEAYRRFLAERYTDSINLLNTTYNTSYNDFSEIRIPATPPFSGAAYADWEYFVANLVAPEDLYLEAPEFGFRDFIRQKYESVQSLNEAYHFGYQSFNDVPLLEKGPLDNQMAGGDWLEFVREEIPVQELELDKEAFQDYLKFLSKTYPSKDEEHLLDIAQLNANYGTRHKNSIDIAMPKLPLRITGKELEDWNRFVVQDANPIHYRIEPERHEEKWREFLRKRHGTIDALNKKWGVVHSSFIEVSPPYLMTDWKELQENSRAIFWELFLRNYKMVCEYLIMHGRGLWNTVVYCGLSVLALLIINPIGAYALSRYQLPSTYKILLFCMLTMAFPPVVLGIPSFLLLKKLGLLNTFAALILPGMANGYSIFLLKGFFDSLPKELYEAATIDGASEFRMFWQVTMALSKPILAVIALQGFTRAYANFMLAFIVCQDERMWTLMVWLYQLQQMASQPVVFASLLVAAIPTLLLFIFCQNIILRGIVVPVEK